MIEFCLGIAVGFTGCVFLVRYTEISKFIKRLW